MNYATHADTRSVYLHWPFCPYKCHFCPFVALAGHDQYMQQYNQALQAELKKFSQNSVPKPLLDTVFIGGGTPSTWPDHLLLDSMGILKEVFLLKELCEVTIEVNPGTVRKEQLNLWKSIGINRLSIGVQGLKDSVLNKLNRLQSKSDVLWVLQEASQVFDNISVDLILGLPGVTDSDWSELLETVVQWPIKHVSIYFLTVHEETLLYYKVKKKEIELVNDDAMVHLYQNTVNFLSRHGFMQYEISNFAKAGYESQHNKAYWARNPYKGFGLGACSFDGASRFQNQKNLLRYIDDAQAGNCVTIFHELLTHEQIRLEKIMLGLRQVKGLALEVLFEALNEQQEAHMHATITTLQENNFLKIVNEHVVLTPAGLAVQNDLAVRFAL